MPVPSRRCACCRCPEDAHQHYTRPSDLRCSSCSLCPRYIDPDVPAPMFRMTADQRRVRRLADQRQAQLVNALLHYQLELERSRRLPIPAQRPPSDPPRRQSQSFTSAYREACTGKPPRRRDA